MLSAVETRRATAILKEAVEKLGFLESIQPDVLQHRDELSKFVGDEISRIILEQRQLEQRYEALIAQRGALKGLANKSKYKEVQNEIQDVSRALRESTKNLCRNLKDNPNISGNLLKIQRERQDLILILKDTIAELQETGTFSTLQRRVAEDQSEQARLTAIIDREHDISEAVKQYDRDLTLERVDHQRLVAEQKQEITKRKQQLQSLKSKTAMDAKYFRKEAHARTCSTARTCRQTERGQEQKTAQLERRRDVEKTVHEETVKFLTQKQKQLAEDLARWEKKYDDDYHALEVEFDRLTQKRVSNLERLTFLKKRRDTELDMERAQREKAQRQAELDRFRLAENEKKRAAASLIQAAWLKFWKIMKEDEARRQADKKGKKGKKKK